MRFIDDMRYGNTAGKEVFLKGQPPRTSPVWAPGVFHEVRGPDARTVWHMATLGTTTCWCSVFLWVSQPTSLGWVTKLRHRKFCSRTRTQHVLQQVLDA